MKKQLRITLESRDNRGHDVSHTDVTTYKGTLASIYFLEDEDGQDFHYCICWDRGSWAEEQFKEELDAVCFVCKECGLMDKYEHLPLHYGNYWNSEVGFIRFDGQGTIDLADFKTHCWPYSTDAGDFELELTKKGILDCSHMGSCDADCERVAQQEYVQKQLQDVSNEAMLSALAQMGVEVEDENNRKDIIETIIWDAARNMREDITGSLNK